MCWKYEKRYSRRRGDYLTKVPYNPRTGGKADTTNSATWSTFVEARDVYVRGGYDGVGFVFAGELVGIDLDDCRNPETGEIAAWARPILASFAGCYMEASPSGTGVHILVLGAMPEGGNRTPYGGGVVEMYGVDRFFTMTGDLLTDAGADPRIEARQDAIDALHAQLFPKAAERAIGPRPEPRPVSLDDAALLDRAMNPDTGAGRDFAALWRGDISAYGDDDSRGDFNAARHLAFWTGGDAARIERLMRSSGLAREKFDQRDGRYGTYLLRTIEKAIYYNAGRYYSGAPATFEGRHLDTREIDAPAQETTDASAPNTQNIQNVDGDAKDKIIAQLRRELAKERERVKYLEGELAWERKLRANKQLSPAQRIVGSALKDQWTRAQAKGASEEMAIHLPTLAKQTGLSERTVSATIVQFHSMGAARREEKHPIAERGPNKGKRVTRLFVDPRPLLEQPEKVKPEVPRNHGGKRICPECGSKHLRVKIRAQLTCVECGHKWETESAERILRGDETEMTARSDAMLVDEVFRGCQDDAPRTAIADDENCALNSVQIRGGKVFTPDDGPGQNHHDERAELLALVEVLGYRTRIPVGLNHNEGGTLVNWQTFAAQADNSLIDEALRTLRIRAEAYRKVG